MRSIVLTLSLLPCLLVGATSQEMLQSLEFIQSCFSSSYGAKEWKENHFDWDLHTEIEKAKGRVCDNTSTKQFQHILKDFFRSCRDYHTGVSFFRTERAELPFSVRIADSRCFIVSIDRDRLPMTSFPFMEGDELLYMDNEPIFSVLETLKQKEMRYENQPATEESLLAMSLTYRSASQGDEVPHGSVTVGIRDFMGNIQERQIHWAYKEESIKKSLDRGERPDPSTELSRLISSKRVFADVGHNLGSLRSWVPYLGTVIWESDSRWNYFHAYIYQNHAGQLIGYLRIPSYLTWGYASYLLAELEEHLAYMEPRVEALVLDQVNNPGGDLFYLYGIAQLFADYPLKTPKHEIALTAEEASSAVWILDALEGIQDDIGAKEAFGPSVSGYPIDYPFVECMRQYCRIILEDFNAGKKLSRPVHLWGVDHINPYIGGAVFTKPVLMLINELDFSGGDFLPAILQDANRALLFGQTTAGAGGFVYQTRFPNAVGIEGFSLTGSHAIREGGASIENIGVSPDILYAPSALDYQSGFYEYGLHVNVSVGQLTGHPDDLVRILPIFDSIAQP